MVTKKIKNLFSIFDKKDKKFSDWLIIGLLLFIVYRVFMFIRNFLQNHGIVDRAYNLKQEDITKAQIDNIKISRNEITVLQNTIPSTKLRKEWLDIADIIQNDLNKSSVSDNTSDAVYQICRCKNDTDVLTLIDCFGKRYQYFFGISLDLYGLFSNGDTLPVFVTENLSKSQIAIINDNYRRKGIKYRF